MNKNIKKMGVIVLKISIFEIKINNIGKKPFNIKIRNINKEKKISCKLIPSNIFNAFANNANDKIVNKSE